MLGAGVAGLLAARVLAEFYAEVTVLDRDTLADGATTRRGRPSRSTRSCAPCPRPAGAGGLLSGVDRRPFGGRRADR
ncbi:MAG: hypothetical protein ACLGI2_16200 [Acidimicrobiia bacterium]